MAKQVIGIAGLSGSGKSILIECFSKKFGIGLKVVRLKELGDGLFKFGNEGHRQIVNYFGEQFLKKNGELNEKKLWKFVYSDQHKLRILDFLLEPLMLNRVQEMIDEFPGIFLVEVISFKLEGWHRILTREILVENSKENVLKNLRKRTDLPVSAEKYLDVQMHLYTSQRAQSCYLFNNSDPGQLEKHWLELSAALDI